MWMRFSDSIKHERVLTLVKGDELDAAHPVCLDLVNFRAALALESGMHNLVRKGAFRSVVGFDTEDKLVIAGVGRAREELATLGVRASDRERLETHDVPLHASSDETGDVFRDGDEDLAGLVSALFTAVHLVLEVNRRNTSFTERLGELHDGRETAVAVQRVCSLSVSKDAIRQISEDAKKTHPVSPSAMMGRK